MLRFVKADVRTVVLTDKLEEKFLWVGVGGETRVVCGVEQVGSLDVLLC